MIENPQGSFVTEGYEGEPEKSRIIFTLTDGFGEECEFSYSNPEELSYLYILVDNALDDLITAHEEGIDAVIKKKGEGESLKESILDASTLDVDNLEDILNMEFTGDLDEGGDDRE